MAHHHNQSHRGKAASATVACVASLVVAAASHASANPTTTLVSVGTGGTPPMCDQPTDFCYSIHPDITPDGRYVVFASVVPNLVPGQITPPGVPQILLHDLHTCTTVRISQTPLGQPGNKPSTDSAISADGSVIAFASRATNLAPGVPSSVDQIYVYNAAGDSLELISKSSGGAPGNQSSAVPRISDDGRWVLFQSSASNLVPNDTNGQPDIFLYDRNSGDLTRVNLNADGEQANGATRRPFLSPNGRFITFDSTAANLVSGSMPFSPQAFLIDRDVAGTGTFDQPGNTSLELVSLSESGVAANGAVFWPYVSQDGRLVAFASSATNLVLEVSNGASHIYLRDRMLGTTTRESVGPGGQQAAGGTYFPTHFSADGRYMTFHSASQDLVAGGHNGMTHVYRRDLHTGENLIVSRNSQGDFADSSSEVGVISASGDVIVFTSAGNNMIPGGSTNPDWVNVYVRRLRPADLNGDGVVNVGDMLLLLSSWGPASCTINDLNEDGNVNVGDLLLLLSDWG